MLVTRFWMHGQPWTTPNSFKLWPPNLAVSLNIWKSSKSERQRWRHHSNQNLHFFWMKNDLNLFILIRLLYPGGLHLIKQFCGIKLKRQDFVPWYPARRTKVHIWPLRHFQHEKPRRRLEKRLTFLSMPSTLRTLARIPQHGYQWAHKFHFSC